MIWDFLFKDSDMSLETKLSISLSFLAVFYFLYFFKPEIRANFKVWNNIYARLLVVAFFIIFIISASGIGDFDSMMYAVGRIISLIAILGLTLINRRRTLAILIVS